MSFRVEALRISRAAVAVAALALAFAAVSGQAWGASGKAPSVGLHQAGHRDPRHHFSCDEALEDGTLVDARQGAVFASLTRGLIWGKDRPAPGGEPSGVRLICGPDLDGDGDKDAIVVIRFPAAKDVSDDVSSLAAATSNAFTWLASKHGATWRAVAPIAFDVSDEPDGQPEVAFVRRARGTTAIEVTRTSFASSGCRIVTYEIFALLSGALQRIEVGDRSAPCTPCGCDRG